MGVYEDMANDAGYPFGSDENAECAGWLEARDRQQMQESHEQDQLEEELAELHAEVAMLSSRLKEIMVSLRLNKCPVCDKPWSIDEATTNKK